MTTGFVLFSVRIPYEFFNSLCCGVGNTPKIQHVLKFVVSLFFVLDVFTQKKSSIEDHKPNIWPGFGLIHVVSIQLIFLLVMSSTTTPTQQVVEVDHHQGQDPCARQDFFLQGKNRCVDWHAYNCHIAKGESTPNQEIRENPENVWCEWWVWVEAWIPQWPWLSFPVHPEKRMTARVKCFPMFSLNFPIFLWLHPQSHVCTCSTKLLMMPSTTISTNIFDSNSHQFPFLLSLTCVRRYPCGRQAQSVWMSTNPMDTCALWPILQSSLGSKMPLLLAGCLSW